VWKKRKELSDDTTVEWTLKLPGDELHNQYMTGTEAMLNDIRNVFVWINLIKGCFPYSDLLQRNSKPKS
jgi:hypothetical protein